MEPEVVVLFAGQREACADVSLPADCVRGTCAPLPAREISLVDDGAKSPSRQRSKSEIMKRLRSECCLTNLFFPQPLRCACQGISRNEMPSATRSGGWEERNKGAKLRRRRGVQSAHHGPTYKHADTAWKMLRELSRSSHLEQGVRQHLSPANNACIGLELPRERPAVELVRCWRR
jgi:hypothetical protein